MTALLTWSGHQTLAIEAAATLRCERTLQSESETPRKHLARWATRLWLVLAYYGHRNAKVLNGGFHRWLIEGRLISDAVPEVSAVSFVPRPDESQIVRLDELLVRYEEPGVQVVSALGPDFYAGRSNPSPARDVVTMMSAAGGPRCRCSWTAMTCPE